MDRVIGGVSCCEEIMTKLELQERAIRPFHVNVPEINRKGDGMN